MAKLISKGIMRMGCVGVPEGTDMEPLREVMDLKAFHELTAFASRKETQGNQDIAQHLAVMTKYWKSMLLPKVVAALDSCASAPLEKLRESWSQAIAVIHVLERFAANAADTPSKEAVSVACVKAQGLSFVGDLEAFEATACSALQIQRAQVLRRVLMAVHTMGKGLPTILQEELLPISSEVVDILAGWAHEGSGMDTWITGNKGSFPDIDQAWFATSAKFVRAHSLVTSLVKMGKERQSKIALACGKMRAFVFDVVLTSASTCLQPNTKTIPEMYL
jgi:hypothetical protein